jgi:hypothetical protein
VTVIVVMLLVIYAEKKVINFLLRTNPDINAILIPDNFDASYTVDLNKVGFKVAFSVEQFNAPYQALDDPSYVSWNVRLKC